MVPNLRVKNWYVTSAFFIGHKAPVFFFFLNQAEKCGRLKIPVCIEERQLPPTSLVKELTSLGLSILKQLHIRMSGDPCRWLIGNV